MSLVIDTGYQQFRSADVGLSYFSDASKDGVIPAQSYSLRTRDGRIVYDAIRTDGVVFDIYDGGLKTGWCRSTGEIGLPPDWRFNASLGKFEPKPEGEGWKRGFSIPVAITKTNFALWEQAQTASFQAVCDVAVKISRMERPDGKLPVVCHTGFREIRLAKGPLQVPVLEVVKWTQRPTCLPPLGY
ncbi:hypothetical protein JL100_027515 [Skermanella mucosa]|uniref:hypothetical protein n=1 Tax=Skermanella TaxID=204447 RepID=UPI00192B37D1|nr:MULTISPECIES: hypothetical protein [Skermanella]UEM03355.1 hypothetical protein JL101_025880 [Skermanella rosea]UEM20782.1 hypothetical protein JL100_027515 [Skermanella mucosa]